MGIIFSFGRFELRPDERALLADGEPVRLGGRAFDILLALVERRDRLVDFDELLDVVWPGLAVEENNLSVHISALRKVLGDKSITTVRGKGYRFTAAIRLSEATQDAPPSPRSPWPRTGAVVAVAAPANDTLTNGRAAWYDGLGGRVLGNGSGAECVAFDQVWPAVVAAMQARRGHGTGSAPRVGIAAIDGFAESDTDTAALAERKARMLAASAGSGDILLTGELASEFVDGVDGDVEDLGELHLDTGAQRTFRVREAAADTDRFLDSNASDGADARPSIAVLPLQCPPGDDADDLFGDALADDVIAGLSRQPELSVVSGLSSRRLRKRGLGRERSSSLLQADLLLVGSYRHSSGRILVRLQLQDANSGEVLCPIEAETGLREAFDAASPLGDRIAARVVQAVFTRAVALSRTCPLPGMDNYALLWGAVGLMHRASPREFERAQAMLQHLTQRAGCMGVASAWLAKWHVLRVVQGWSPNASVDAGLALELVRRSLDEDSRDALALSIGGLVHAYLRKDLQAAGTLYDEAIDANPSEPLAWLFSATRLAYLGHGSQAEEAGERALRLSPIDPLKYFFDSLVATAALANSSWERSEMLCRRSLRANRTHASTWRTLAFALVQLDRMDEARDAVQHLLAIEPGFTVGRFKDRFPGRDGPMAQPWAEALKAAGLPA